MLGEGLFQGLAEPRTLIVNAIDEEAQLFWVRRGLLPSRDDAFRSMRDRWRISERRWRWRRGPWSHLLQSRQLVSAPRRARMARASLLPSRSTNEGAQGISSI